MSAVALTDYERRYCTEGAQGGILLSRWLTDADVLAAARDTQSVAYAFVLIWMGDDTNRSWITARCAEEAYERGLIDEQELDWICR